MKKFGLVPLSLAALLGACSSGDQQTVQFSEGGPELIYSYPYLTQAEVPTHAPIVLRFSEALTNSDDELTESVKVLDQSGETISVTISTADHGRSIVLTPSTALEPKTRYTIQAEGLRTASGGISWQEDFSFVTRAATEGPASQVSLANEFSVTRMIPDGTNLPIMDFSTLRLQFTQPLDQTSLKYGENLRLETANGETVEASVIAQGHYLSIDPTEDLQAGRTYKLVLENSLRSTLDKPLSAGEFGEVAITPKDSHPREIMVQKAGDSYEEIRSILTGELINAVPVKALLLGDQSLSQQTGDVHAELAFVPNYPDVTPLRIPKGSLLKGTSVEVVINGNVPAGFDSGDISVTFISDANGFLLPNQYSNDEAAPRHVRLYMDLAMNTANPKANGALSQDLLHVELAGTAIVQDGVMVINAVGVVEPKALGLETAYGTLSFHMEAYRDQENAPQMEQDTNAPELLSWVPGDHADKQRPGDPIILNFNEPLDRASLEQDGAWKLYADGIEIPKEEVDWRLDGGSLVIEPRNGLQFNVPYVIQLSNNITDLAGNELSVPDLQFSLPALGSGATRSPLALTVYPGYPCAISPATQTQELAQGFQGRCQDGEPGDDKLPLQTLPSNRSIVVRFSQDMDINSIQLGSSFRVERVDTNGNNPDAVPGHLKVDARTLKFTPDEPWQEGQFYRYVLASVQSNPNCGTNAICSAEGYPLQTNLLSAPGATDGGPNMVNYFKGGPAVKTVFNPLWNLPTVDVNANLTLDDDEKGPEYVSPTMADKAGRENTAHLISDDSGVGCKQNESCPKDKYLMMTANLNTEVIGWDEAEKAIRVKLYPSVLMTTSITVVPKILGIIPAATPTGSQLMRMRYQKDANGNRTELIDGYIRETPDGPIFTTKVDLYLDAPYLRPTLNLSHNLHSYELPTMELEGPITFFEDGRMQIEQYNTNEITIETQIGSLGNGIVRPTLKIPPYGNYLNYTSKIIKD